MLVKDFIALKRKELERVPETSRTVVADSLEIPAHSNEAPEIVPPLLEIEDGAHLFEAIQKVWSNEVDALQVIDDEGLPVEVVHRKELADQLYHMLNLHQRGTIISIAVEKKDLSLSEITRLIEAENTLILGMTVEQSKEGDAFLISLKLNSTEISLVISALERHGYFVTSVSDKNQASSYAHRVDELLHLLNI